VEFVVVPLDGFQFVAIVREYGRLTMRPHRAPPSSSSERPTYPAGYRRRGRQNKSKKGWGWLVAGTIPGIAAAVLLPAAVTGYFVRVRVDD
jgi:hypothetical protein